VWHASVSRGDAISRRLIALEVLRGIGNADDGEWWEVGGIADHLRRRLSAEEARVIGPVIDVRTTAEGARRFAAMRPYLPPAQVLE
jgi:hypothetical protein